MIVLRLYIPIYTIILPIDSFYVYSFIYFLHNAFNLVGDYGNQM